MIARLLTGLICLLALFGCARPADDSIRFGIASAPLNLDPRFATDATSTRINRLLYAALVDFDDRARPIPALADWQPLAPDHYRFTLRPTARDFHHGRRLIAADVKATYDSVLDPATASPHRVMLALIDHIETQGTEVIDFYLRRPDPLFPAYLTIGILPAERLAAASQVHRRPVGSGPFQFVDWPEEGRLILQRRDDGQRFEFVRVADPAVRTLKLLRGEVDILQNDLSPELQTYLEKQEGIRVQRAHGSNYTYLGLNMEDPALSRLEVRQALAHAIDRQAILEHVFKGAGRRAEALLPPEHWAGVTGLQPYAHDPAEARRLLASAGFDRAHPLRLVYKTSSDPFRLRLATILQSQLAEAGIEVELRSYDWSTFYGDIKAGNFQLYSLAWVGIKTPDIFRYAYHSASLPPAGANRGRYRNATLDRLIETGETAHTLAHQAEYYQAIQQWLHDDLPVIPLWFEDQVAATGVAVQGYTPAADGNYDALLHTHKQARQ